MSFAPSLMLDELLQQVNKYTDIFSRIDLLTTYFLGTPYILGAQGEGERGEFDQFPLCRFDGFDCLTFVNNILALSFSHDIKSFEHYLLHLNYYEALPKYENRFHFMSLDWNPQNQRQGFLRDITETIVNAEGKPIAAMAEGVIDKKSWFLRRTEKDIRLTDALCSPEKLAALRNLAYLYQSHCVRMPYLPLETLLANPHYFDQFPEVSIIEIVRPNWDLKEKIGTNLHVSHIGFGLRLPSGGLVFRHASSESKAVVAVSLQDYLESCLTSPTIKGIHLQEVKINRFIELDS